MEENKKIYISASKNFVKSKRPNRTDYQLSAEAIMEFNVAARYIIFSFKFYYGLGIYKVFI